MPLHFFKYSWPRGFEASRGSDGDPDCVHLVLESQQAVGNAFLVARQPHPNPLDVTVGEGERELGDGWGRGEDERAQRGQRPDRGSVSRKLTTSTKLEKR